MAHLRSVVDRTRPLELGHRRLLPLTGATEHLLAGGGLARGSIVQVCGGAGATTLALALVAGPCHSGSWVACVGFPQLGWEAAEEVGLPLERLVAVRTPPQQWTKVVAALLDAFEVVLCGPEVVPGAGELRNLQARARERESVLVGVVGSATALDARRRVRRWPLGDVVLRVERSRWQGLGQGWGHLGQRHLDVVVEGRGELSRSRRETVCIDSAGRPTRAEGQTRLEQQSVFTVLAGAGARNAGARNAGARATAGDILPSGRGEDVRSDTLSEAG
jgi:hypothetical protein